MLVSVEKKEMSKAEQKCCMKKCNERGVPQEGFDFFVCDGCLKTLRLCLKREAERRYGKHDKN